MVAPTALELLSDPVTILSLGTTAVLLLAAYLISLCALSARATGKIRTIFVWHLFDALVHFILEAPFVYYSLFSRATAEQLLQQPAHIQALPYPVAGVAFSDTPMAKLWQVYAESDLRWSVGEPNIVAMEIVTAFVAGPLAAYIVYLIAKDECTPQHPATHNPNKKWLYIVLLATMELYGGFMTFVPEWIIGSPNLVTSNWVYKWLYLAFFNGVWVIFPAWTFAEGYSRLVSTRAQDGRVKTS